jgi:acyl-CoA synthetase (AMP-forming)/AMP-acid ligase II
VLLSVFPTEVKAVLVTQLDGVDVVVLGLPDVTQGGRVEAAVVAQPGATLTVESLRGFGRNGLAAYKLPDR